MANTVQSSEASSNQVDKIETTFQGDAMHRLLFVLLLAVSSNAMANWAYQGFTGVFTLYANQAAAKKNGNVVVMWSLYDFDQQHDDGHGSFLSAKAQSEYDCRGEQMRTLTGSWYSGKMGAGTSIFSTNKISDWRPIISGSVDEGLWKIACMQNN